MKLAELIHLLARLRRGKILYIGGSDILPPPLDREAEAAALAGLEAGDRQAKALLIEHNLRLVVYIARRFESAGVNLEDLISIGTIGLINGHQYLPPGPEHQAGHLRLPLHRKRDTDGAAQDQSVKDRSLFR